MNYRTLPNQELMEAVVRLLREVQSTPVYEYLDSSVSFPFIAFGSIEVEPDGSKDVNTYQVTMELEINSRQRSRREINDILTDLMTIFSRVHVDRYMDKFTIMAQEITNVVTEPREKVGYVGIMQLMFMIQEKE